jgi:UDP-glucose 4-epimerase
LPKNPYGETKLAVEKMLKWADDAYGLKYTALRYFNAAGAHISGRIGEDHNPESHLIPLILQVPLGKRSYISIFGTDYPTEDGTCVRDYIHVTDLSQAHILALKRLVNGGESSIYNLGNGKGFSVKEVIETARKVTGHDIKAVESERRPGDPAVLIASSERAITELNWKPSFNDLEMIIRTAWNWHKNHPDGYGDS